MNYEDVTGDKSNHTLVLHAYYINFTSWGCSRSATCNRKKTPESKIHAQTTTSLDGKSYLTRRCSSGGRMKPVKQGSSRGSKDVAVEALMYPDMRARYNVAGDANEELMGAEM